MTKRIEFTAAEVQAIRTEYSDDYVVYGIFFEESDPEQGGQSWNFQRALGADGTINSLGEEDEGVCVVKEVQRLVVQDGISQFILGRNKMECTFKDNDQFDGIKGLIVNYMIDDNKWNELSNAADKVFIECTWYRRPKT